MSIYLAYDGSVNANWIARYAIRMAAHHPEKRLYIVYIGDAGTRAPNLSQGINQIETEAEQAGVEAVLQIRPMRHGVFGGLQEHIPQGPETFVICGARVKRGHEGYLRGTISEQLLKLRQFNVMALRVVQPGLLGVARNVLAPVSRNPLGFKSGMKFLELLAPDIQRLHLIQIIERSRRPIRLQPAARIKERRNRAQVYIRGIEADIVEKIPMQGIHVDSHVDIAESWSNKINIHATRLHTNLIYLEIPRQSLTKRFLFSDPLEDLLSSTFCDIAVYRGIE